MFKHVMLQWWTQGIYWGQMNPPHFLSACKTAVYNTSLLFFFFQSTSLVQSTEDHQFLGEFCSEDPLTRLSLDPSGGFLYNTAWQTLQILDPSLCCLFRNCDTVKPLATVCKNLNIYHTLYCLVINITQNSCYIAVSMLDVNINSSKEWEEH